VGREGAVAPAGLELQLGWRAWRAAHGCWGSEGRKMGRGAEGAGLVAVWVCCLSKEKAHYCSAAAGNSVNLAPFFGVFF